MSIIEDDSERRSSYRKFSRKICIKICGIGNRFLLSCPENEDFSDFKEKIPVLLKMRAGKKRLCPFPGAPEALFPAEKPILRDVRIVPARSARRLVKTIRTSNSPILKFSPYTVKIMSRGIPSYDSKAMSISSPNGEFRTGTRRQLSPAISGA